MTAPKLVVLMTAVCAVLAWSPSADAQRIRSYAPVDEGTSGGGGGGGGAVYYPGQPQPQGGAVVGQPTGQQQAGPAQEGGAGGEKTEEAVGTFRIQVYRPGAAGGAGGRRGPRTTLDLAIEQMYSGVIPGKRAQVAHLTRAREKGQNPAQPNQLTWIGFQPEKDVTRVFLETARSPDYSTRTEQSEAGPVYVVTLSNTQIPARNFRRFLDTSYFERDVERIEAKKVDQRTVELHIQLEKRQSPTLQTDGNFLFVDFPYTPPSDDPGAR